MMEFVKFSSRDTTLYHQSIALRNRDLYGVIGIPNLSDEGQKIEKDNLFFGVLDNERLVSTVAFYEVAAGHFQLVAMAVSREYQGQGIGSRLIVFALNCLKEAQGKHFIVTTNARQSALSFYLNFGFKVTGDVFSSAYHNGSKSVPMRLDYF